MSIHGRQGGGSGPAGFDEVDAYKVFAKSAPPSVPPLLKFPEYARSGVLSEFQEPQACLIGVNMLT